jgi:hypothetical protein
MKMQNPDQFKASSEFTQIVMSRLSTDRGIHAETAISAAARMAGTFVLRSCGLPLANLAPGTPVFSDLIDEQGQNVLRTIDEVLAEMNVVLDGDKLVYDIPEDNSPHMELPDVQSMFDASFRTIAEKYNLTEEESAHAAAASVGVLIQKASGILDPHVGYIIATYGMIEGCKTVPFFNDPAAAGSSVHVGR